MSEQQGIDISPAYLKWIIGNLVIRLPDALGAKSLVVTDKDGTHLLDVQSDGDVSIGGDLAVGGGVSGIDHGLLDGLADDDHAIYLLANGARALTGNLAVDASVTIDGVDLSVHVTNADAHHAGFVGLTGDTPANVDPDGNDRIQVTGGSGISVTEGTNKLTVSYSGGGGPPAPHVITGPYHTVTGSQWDLVGLTATDTLGLLTPSSDPGAAAAILKTDTSGVLHLVELHADTIRDEAGANLTIAPAGDIVVNPTGDDVLPGAGYDINLGSLPKKYLTLHAAELWVETLVAQDTLATIGGRILVGPTTELTSDLAPAATTLYVKHNQMTNGDRVVLEADGKLEFLAVTSGPGGAGPYSYTVTRNLDGTGANQWYAGDAVFNTGAAGDGFIDLYSVHALNVGGNAGPTIVGNVRNSTVYNDWTEHWAIGNLDGLYGYGTDIYGVGLGEHGGEYVTIEATSGIRMYSSGSQRVQIDTDGSFWFGDSATTERLGWDVTNGLRIFDANNVAVIALDTAGNAAIKGDALIDGTVTAEKLNVVVGGYNMLINSGINDDDDGDGVPDEWTEGTNITNHTNDLSPTYKVVGASSFHVEVSAGDVSGDYHFIQQTITLANVPLAADDRFALSGYIQTALDCLRTTIYVQWWDITPALISSDSVGWITSDESWTRHTVTGTVPATAVTAKVLCEIQLTEDDGAGHVWFDAIKLERGDVPTAWTTGMIGNVVIDSNRVQVMDSSAKVWIGKRGSSLGMWGEDTAGNLEVGWYASGVNAGAIVAGGNAVVLNDDGIEIKALTTYTDTRSYKFVDPNGNTTARLGGIHDTGVDHYRGINLRTFPYAGMGSTIWVIGESPQGQTSQVNLWATHDDEAYDHEAFLSCSTDESNEASIWWTLDGSQMGEFNKDHSHIVLYGTAVTGTNVDVQEDWELTYSTSVRAAKTNIQPFAADRQVFMSLKPTTFNAIEAPDGPSIVGLVAEEVAETLPGLATYLDMRGLSRRRPKRGPPELELVGWDNRQMLVTTISVVQQHEADLRTLKATVAALQVRDAAWREHSTEEGQ